MTDESLKIEKELNKINEEIGKVSNQLAMLKHEYRQNTDDKIQLEIKNRWGKLQKMMTTLVKKRAKILEKKSEIDYKRKWNITPQTVIQYF